MDEKTSSHLKNKKKVSYSSSTSLNPQTLRQLTPKAIIIWPDQYSHCFRFVSDSRPVIMDTEVPGQVTGSEVHSSPVSHPTLPATDHHQVDTDQHQNRTAEKYRSAENDWHAERAKERDWGGRGGAGTSVHPHEKGQEPHDEDRICLVRDPLFSNVVYHQISVVEKQLTI